MKKLFALILALLLAGTSACAGVGETISGLLEGDVTGEVGKEYQTAWFAFQINSLETAETYQDKDAEEGYVFLVANIYEKNIWASEAAADKPLPMSAADFFLLEADGTERILPEYPWDEAMMPAEFQLALDEEVTYDVVFSIPEDLAEVSLVYEEIDTEQVVHATFTIVKAMSNE